MTTLKAQIAKAILEHRYPSEDDAANGYADVPPQVVQEIDALAAAVAGKLPDHAGTDFVRMMETWTESQTNLTAALLDMAICATLKKVLESRHGHSPSKMAKNPGMAGVRWSATEPNTLVDAEIIITSAELRAIAEQYHWERTEEAGSWAIRLQKISEMSSDQG